MTDLQEYAWLHPCLTEAQETDPRLAHWFDRDRARWFVTLAVTLKPAVVRVPCWHVSISGFSCKLRPIPVTDDQGNPIWNDLRIRCASTLGDEVLNGVGARLPNGSPAATIHTSPMTWHIYVPLTGAESMTLKQRP